MDRISTENLISELVRPNNSIIAVDGFSGAVIMATSSVWGYLAFLAGPKFARRNELRRTENPDGSIETQEIDSSTMIATAPERPDRS